MNKSTTQINGNKIFIVYDSHEEALAEALSNLLRLWGQEPFYCRQEERKSGGKTYRRHLADQLKASDLVLLLLSREFRWSPYCQSEAGATMTMNMKALPITIPPVTVNDISSICPVLEGLDVVAIPSQFVKDESSSIFSSLRKELQDRLGSAALPEADFAAEKLARQQVIDELSRIVDDYHRNTPEKALMSVWPSIDTGLGNAKDSIIGNIKASLASGELTTSLSFVGVSLKYSLPLISQALEDFASEVKNNQHDLRKARVSKELTIELVHMDANAHILHSLDDSFDIKSIYANLNKDWDSTVRQWAKHCREAHITLKATTAHRIDYMPPRVGILIDDDKLYAGRCSIKKRGAAEAYHLLVGEKEYFFYSKWNERKEIDIRGHDRIIEFTDAIKAYSNPIHNGARLVCADTDKDKWIAGLEECIRNYKGISELTVLSTTCTKFQHLISSALKKGINVNIHTLKPDIASETARHKICDLMTNLEDIISRKTAGTGTYTVRPFCRPSTFRAAILGNEVIGVQMYQHRAESGALRTTNSMGKLDPSPLRLIVTKDSAHYASLKEMVEQFLEEHC